MSKPSDLRCTARTLRASKLVVGGKGVAAMLTNAADEIEKLRFARDEAALEHLFCNSCCHEYRGPYKLRECPDCGSTNVDTMDERCTAIIESLEAETKKLRADLTTCRADAMEECAVIAYHVMEHGTSWTRREAGKDIGDRIRQLRTSVMSDTGYCRLCGKPAAEDAGLCRSHAATERCQQEAVKAEQEQCCADMCQCCKRGEIPVRGCGGFWLHPETSASHACTCDASAIRQRAAEESGE